MDASEREAWRMENFASAYRAWIASGMHAEDHSILLDILHETEYEWHVPMDSNRADWGRNLRLRFAYETGLECRDEWVDWPCSFLEMLVGLAYSLEENVLYDGLKGDRTPEWFWMMLRNMGLDRCSDIWMMTEPGSMGFVERAVRDAESGKHPIFPLEQPADGMDLWAMAHAYIYENDVR